MFKNNSDAMQRWVEINSHSERCVKNYGDSTGKTYTPPVMLTFDTEHIMWKRTYAGTEIYTVELRALARLEDFVVNSDHAHGKLEGGYLQVQNPELLLGRIKSVGGDAMAEHKTSIVVVQNAKIQEAMILAEQDKSEWELDFAKEMDVATGW